MMWDTCGDPSLGDHSCTAGVSLYVVWKLDEIIIKVLANGLKNVTLVYVVYMWCTCGVHVV